MIIGLTGYARSGKDSAAGFLVEKYDYTKQAFGDGVRDLAAATDPYVRVDADRHYTEGNTPFARYSTVVQAIGYDAAKSHPDVRRLLQRIGTEAVRNVLGEDAWVHLMSNKLVNMGALGLQADSTHVVISDVRFANEVDFIHAYGGVVVRLVRPGYGGDDVHVSEAGIDQLDADFTLVATNLTELASAVDTLMVESVPSLLARRRDESAEWMRTAVATEPRATRIYLAAPWVHKAEAAAVKQRLIHAGLDVVSGWTERENTPAEIDPTRMHAQAQLDRDEVVACDVLVVLGLSKSEGKATEMGMALALGKRILLVKEDCIGNIFYHLPEVERVDSVEEVIWRLGGLPENTTLIDVRRIGDNVVAVETGQVVATKLGDVSSADFGEVAKRDEPPTEFKFGLHTAGDGVDPLRQAITEHITGDVVD